MERAESKKLYLRYRERARELYQSDHVPTNESPIADGKISIGEWAPVQRVEEGAWVEAMVWVPKEKLE